MNDDIFWFSNFTTSIYVIILFIFVICSTIISFLYQSGTCSFYCGIVSFSIYTTFSIFFLLFILVLFLHSGYTTNAIVSKPDLVKLAVLLKLPTLPCEARWNMLYWI